LARAGLAARSFAPCYSFIDYDGGVHTLRIPPYSSVSSRQNWRHPEV